MPINVACHCGASFRAKDELAGQTLLCPKCHQPLTIAPPNQQKSAGGIDDLFEDVGLKEVRGPRCPQCGEGVLPNAVLCVACGYHLQTGEKIAGVQQRAPGSRGHSEASEALLARAAQRIEDEKLEEKKTRSQGAPVLVYLAAFIGVIAFAATMFMLPRDRAFVICGTGVLIFGGLMSAYYGIRMIITAFQEDIVCGLLWLFIPPYQLYYLFTRWERVGAFFLMQLVGTVVIFVGMGMIAIAPMMKMDSSEQARIDRPARPEASVWQPGGEFHEAGIC